MRNKLLITIILGIFVVSVWGSAFHAAVIAQEQEKDQPDHERQVQVQYSANQFQLESELKNGSVKDHISVEVQTHTNYPSDNVSGKAEIRFVYTRENVTETSIKYNVDLMGLIEYKENGTQWGYQPSEKVADYSIGGTGWNNITYSYDNSTGGDIHNFNVSTADGVVTLLFHISGNVAADGNTTLTPNTAKMDILINNFPYKQTGDSLALLANVRTGTKLEHSNDTAEEDQGYTTNEQALNMNANGTTGYFSWSDTVMANGAVANVIPSSVVTTNASSEYDGEAVNQVTFSFNTTDASSIVWDPRVGVVTADVQAVLTPATTPTPTSTTPVTSSTPATTPAPTTTQQKSKSSSSPFMSLFLVSSVFVMLSVIVRKRSN